MQPELPGGTFTVEHLLVAMVNTISICKYPPILHCENCTLRSRDLIIQPQLSRLAAEQRPCSLLHIFSCLQTHFGCLGFCAGHTTGSVWTPGLVPIESNGNGDRHESRPFADCIYGAGLDTSTPRVLVGQFRYKAVDSLCCERARKKIKESATWPVEREKPDIRPLAYVKEWISFA
ncbi:hypothetical protein CDAR_559351 [Caerostris darwini]|uniref:Uncharacterized protein n=1 Tax=Caerostris darwini TaxID=1538125 RepID=A0AAV4P0Y0_9ARAC|nr:hypothetical protein CDAR_559351 [Caerostris darwini]